MQAEVPAEVSATRVLVVSHVAGLDGGAERSLLESVTGLAQSGAAEVEVVVPAVGALSDALAAARVVTHVAPVPWWVSWNRPTPSGPRGVGARAVAAGSISRRLATAAAPALALLARTRPDVVLTNTATIPTFAVAARRAGIPHVWSVREFVRPEFRYLLGEAAAHRLIGALSCRVVFNSDAVRRHYHPGVPSSKAVVVHPGVPPVVPSPPAPSHEGVRLLLLGRVAVAKGHRVAVEAVGIAARAGVDADLEVVGPGGDRHRAVLSTLAAEHGVADRVHVHDADPDPTGRLARCDAVVVPSGTEGFGRVTVEALRAGRPVLASRTGGSLEIVDDGVNGLLFEPGSAADLAAAIVRFATDAPVRARLEARAAPSVAGRFLPEPGLRRLAAVLHQAAGTRSARGGGSTVEDTR